MDINVNSFGYNYNRDEIIKIIQGLTYYQIVILRLLLKNDLSGIDIMNIYTEKINSNSSGLGEGTIYPALEKLKNLNLLEKYKDDSNNTPKRRGKRKMIYTITLKGKEVILKFEKIYHDFRTIDI